MPMTRMNLWPRRRDALLSAEIFVKSSWPVMKQKRLKNLFVSVNIIILLNEVA